MTTIADLARELGAQPHEVSAFGDLGVMPQDVDLPADTVTMIREAWAAPEYDVADDDA